MDKKDVFLVLLPVIFTALIGGLFWFHRPFGAASDVNHYVRISNSVTAARSHQTDSINSEYPPLVTTLFYTIGLLPLADSYKTQWIIFFLIFFSVILLYTYLRLSRRDYFILMATVLLSAFLLQPNLVFARYDFIIALSILLSWQAYRHKRPADSAAFIVIAALSKLIPIIILPALLYLLPPRHRKSAFLGATITTLICLLLPIIVLGPSLTHQNLTHMVTYQGQRGIGIESTWSGLNLLFNALNGQTSQVVTHHFAAHNDSVASWVAPASLLVYLIGIGVIYLIIFFRGRPGNAHHLAASFIALLTWSCAVAPVLSPQYLIWFIPLSLAWLLSQKTSQWHAMKRSIITSIVAIILSAIFTQILWPTYYQQFLAQESFMLTLMLNLRNLALFIITGSSLYYLAYSHQPDKISSEVNVRHGSLALP